MKNIYGASSPKWPPNLVPFKYYSDITKNYGPNNDNPQETFLLKSYVSLDKCVLGKNLWIVKAQTTEK